jgi:hypothetical protein
MFTRCPFPPGSYDWDDRLAEIIDNKQLYFIKPGKSVLIPPSMVLKNGLSAVSNAARAPWSSAGAL